MRIYALYFISLVRFFFGYFCPIWLMRIFSRTKSRIRQEPSVQFWIIVWEMLRAGDKTFRTQLVWWKPRATQEGLKCILKLQSWYCRVTYRNMGYYKKLQTNMCYKMSFFSKDIMTCMLSNKTCYCSGLYTIETLLHSQTNQKIANFQHSPLITSKMVSICTF